MKKFMLFCYVCALLAAAVGAWLATFDGAAGLLTLSLSCFFWGVARFLDPEIHREVNNEKVSG